MFVFSIFLLALTGDISVAGRIKPNALFVPSRSLPLGLQGHMPSDGNGQPWGSSAHSHTGRLGPAHGRSDEGNRTFSLSRPRSFGWQRRVSSPVMSVLDHWEQRVELLKDNLERLQGTGDRGRAIVSLGLRRFDMAGGNGLKDALLAVVTVAKRLNVPLMFHPGTRSVRLAIRRDRAFDTIPLDTKVQLDLSKPPQHGFQLIDSYASGGADIITVFPTVFNKEWVAELTPMLDRIKAHGVLCGLVMKPETSVSSIEQLLKANELHMVVIVVKTPGHGGGAEVDAALDKIREIRRICTEYDVSEPYISVDGWVHQNYVHKFLHAGANVIVAGGNVVEGVAQAVAKYNARMVSIRDMLQGVFQGGEAMRALVRESIGQRRPATPSTPSSIA